MGAGTGERGYLLVVKLEQKLKPMSLYKHTVELKVKLYFKLAKNQL